MGCSTPFTRLEPEGPVQYTAHSHSARPHSRNVRKVFSRMSAAMRRTPLPPLTGLRRRCVEGSSLFEQSGRISFAQLRLQGGEPRLGGFLGFYGEVWLSGLV